MISNRKEYKKLCIDIITFRTEINNNCERNLNQSIHAMNTTKDKHTRGQNKFICSICLNQKIIDDNKTKESDLTERISKSCPVCHQSYTSSVDGDSTVTRDTNRTIKDENNDQKITKDVKTLQTDVSQGLTLLHEVLNAFQSKKQVNNRKESRKTLILKDVGVSTEEITNIKAKPKLTICKVFKFSIDDKRGHENKFAIVNSNKMHESSKFLHLIKHKSSSIPQMKLEELKNSLKEKTKSKDAMEEANRIFANVKKVDNNINNRPMIRNGPRVLPVVKTANFEDTADKKILPRIDQTCKCCQQNNFNMSGGDSSEKKCIHSCKNCVEKCDDCVYTCFHCKQNRQQSREITCKRCRSNKHDTECNR